MSDPHQSQNVLIISNDASVVDAIINNNKTDQKINARPSVQEALSESGLFENNSIVIFDIGTTENNVDQAISQAIKLKQADPTQVLMIVGNKEPLSEILKSNIQPMLYRAFNKPISPNQLFLSFKSANALHVELIGKRAAGEDILVVGPQENKTNVDLIAEERKTNPLIFAGIGAFVLAIVAYLFLSGDEPTTPQPQVTAETIQPREIPKSTVQTNVNSKLDLLNLKAKNALSKGRLISPAGDNALEYYDQALVLDPYDPVAFEGRKSVAAALRKSYDNLISEKKYDDAFSALDKITSIDPLNPDNDSLRSELEEAVTKKVASTKSTNTSSDKVLKKISKAKTASSSAQQAEQVLIKKIQSSIASNNLIPPQANNAYTLLSGALRGKKISRAKSSPLLRSLSSKLMNRANSTFARNDLDQTTDIMSYVNRIDVNNRQLADLRSRVNAQKIASSENRNQQSANAAIAAKKQADAQAFAAAKSTSQVIPPKVLSRSSPRYPSSAERQNIEGWVELTFKVNTKGEPQNVSVSSAQPSGYFEEAAIKSIKKWTYSPARNKESGKTVISKPVTARITFKIDE